MQLNIRIEKHSPRRHEEHEEKQKRLTFLWLPSSSFQVCIPKLELGNEYNLTESILGSTS